MEAVWTRYFPLSVQVRDIIQKGEEIGEVVRVQADLSTGDAEGFDVASRMVNLDLAGGALLDCMPFFIYLARSLLMVLQWESTP
jgi:predicted dehydrogenase